MLLSSSKLWCIKVSPKEEEWVGRWKLGVEGMLMSLGKQKTLSPQWLLTREGCREASESRGWVNGFQTLTKSQVRTLRQGNEGKPPADVTLKGKLSESIC